MDIQQSDGGITSLENAGTPDRWENAYAGLKRYGHSAAKAAEIILDAKRGDQHARNWLFAVGVVV